MPVRPGFYVLDQPPRPPAGARLAGARRPPRLTIAPAGAVRDAYRQRGRGGDGATPPGSGNGRHSARQQRLAPDGGNGAPDSRHSSSPPPPPLAVYVGALKLPAGDFHDSRGHSCCGAALRLGRLLRRRGCGGGGGGTAAAWGTTTHCARRPPWRGCPRLHPQGSPSRRVAGVLFFSLPSLLLPTRGARRRRTPRFPCRLRACVIFFWRAPPLDRKNRRRRHRGGAAVWSALCRSPAPALGRVASRDAPPT